MDYYDSGTIDPSTGMYIDRFGYPVVERGTPIIGFPADTNPTDTERNIQVLRTNRIETIDGTSLEMPPISLTSVTTPLVVGNPDLELRTVSDGKVRLKDTGNANYVEIEHDSATTAIKALNPNPTASLAIQTHGDGTLFLRDDATANSLEIKHDPASSTIQAKNGGTDAGLYLITKNSGATNITNETLAGSLKIETTGTGANLTAGGSGGNGEMKIVCTGTSPLYFQRQNIDGYLQMNLNPSQVQLSARAGVNPASFDFVAKGTGTHIFRDDATSGALEIDPSADAVTLRGINGVGPNCGLLLESKNDGVVKIANSAVTTTMGFFPQSTTTYQMYADSPGADATLKIFGKGAGKTIITKLEPPTELQFDFDNTSCTIQAEHDSNSDTSIVIRPNEKGQLRAPDYGFQLYTWSATQAIPATTNTKVIFLQEAYTTFPSGFITYSGTNTYTNTSGATCHLLVTASIRGTFDSTIGSPELWIQKNNGTGSIFLGKMVYPVGTTSGFGITTTAIVRLDNNENFSIWTYMSQAATIGNNTGAAEPHKVTVLDVRYMP